MTIFKSHEFTRNISWDIQVQDNTLFKIDDCIDRLNELRSQAGFPIKITDGIRVGNGTSQHFFHGDGAVDIRPANPGKPGYDHQVHILGLLLTENESVFRVCYYPPGKLFFAGGFHLDRKIPDKQLFISHPDRVEWTLVDRKNFIAALPRLVGVVGEVVTRYTDSAPVCFTFNPADL